MPAVRACARVALRRAANYSGRGLADAAVQRLARSGPQHTSGTRAGHDRQAELVRHALRHPYQEYTIAGHRRSHSVVYQTARTDLLDLQRRGVLEQRKRGRTMVFTVPRDLAERLQAMGGDARHA